MGDVLHSKEISEEEIFEGVNYKKIVYEHKDRTGSMVLLHENMKNSNERYSNFNKFLENLEKLIGFELNMSCDDV